MRSIKLKIHSLSSKFWLKRRLQTLLQTPISDHINSYAVVSRAGEITTPSNPSFATADGVATRDFHIDPLTSLSVRIFLPDSAIISARSKESTNNRRFDYNDRSKLENRVYNGYLPEESGKNCRKLPVVLQFHGGIWVSGGNNTVFNDRFCRRLAKSCDAIVVAVGYRLAPENKYPAAFEDGVKVLNWLGKQANLADHSGSPGNRRFTDDDGDDGGRRRQIVDGFGDLIIEPWLAAHGDFSRCIILGVNCGANIANYVTRKAVKAGKLLNPVRVVAQILMYPFFIGSVPTPSELKLADSYPYSKAISLLAWKLFLPQEEFNLDHLAANPLITGGEVHLKNMPPTLTVVAENDWMKDRAIAYSEELRKVNVDSPLHQYKDAVHDFATLDWLLETPEVQACLEDIALWAKKYVSLSDNELSY